MVNLWLLLNFLSLLFLAFYSFVFMFDRSIKDDIEPIFAFYFNPQNGLEQKLLNEYSILFHTEQLQLFNEVFAYIKNVWKINTNLAAQSQNLATIDDEKTVMNNFGTIKKLSRLRNIFSTLEQYLLKIFEITTQDIISAEKRIPPNSDN